MINMQRVLFNQTIFGPIHSRRLGTSLGVNLSPRDGKICSFDCLYCEAGYNAQGPGTTGMPTRAEVADQLAATLQRLISDGVTLDVITFSGNGEPTLHPDFAGIVNDVITLRDKLAKKAKISVLTNSTCAHIPSVATALRRVDNNIAKLDSARDETVRLLDRPNDPGYSVARVIDALKAFDGTCIIQTMITRGTHDGVPVDNSTDDEVAALIEAYRAIAPRQIMLYSIDRQTPEHSLVKIPREALLDIANRVTAATGIDVTVA